MSGTVGSFNDGSNRLPALVADARAELAAIRPPAEELGPDERRAALVVLTEAMHRIVLRMSMEVETLGQAPGHLALAADSLLEMVDSLDDTLGRLNDRIRRGQTEGLAWEWVEVEGLRNRLDRRLAELHAAVMATESPRRGQSGAHVPDDAERARTAAKPEWPVRWRRLDDGTLYVVLGRRLAEPPSFGQAIPVESYLATDDADAAAIVYRALDELAEMLGYERSEEIQTRSGSIYRRAKATVRRIFKSEELTSRVAAVERALELRHLDGRQADVDSKEAAAVAQLLTSLEEIPQACIRVGSILLIKVPDATGPVLLVRTLSPTEIRALERFPEIQMRPSEVLERLATAIAADRGGIPPAPRLTAHPIVEDKEG